MFENIKFNEQTEKSKTNDVNFLIMFVFSLDTHIEHCSVYIVLKAN